MKYFGKFTETPQEHAAVMLSEAQHAPGVTARMNPNTFRVEYIRPDCSIVPPYSWFLTQEYLPVQKQEVTP